MVEQTGVVVACPHCGAHLQIGDVPQMAPPPGYYQQPNFGQQNYPPPNYPQQNYAPPNYQQPGYPQSNPQGYPQGNPQFFTPPLVPPEDYRRRQDSAPQLPDVREWAAERSAPIPESRRPDAESPVAELPIKVAEPPSGSSPGATAGLKISPSFELPSLPAAGAPQASDSWIPQIDLSTPPPIKLNSPAPSEASAETMLAESTPIEAPVTHAPVTSEAVVGEPVLSEAIGDEPPATAMALSTPVAVPATLAEPSISAPTAIATPVDVPAIETPSAGTPSAGTPSAMSPSSEMPAVVAEPPTQIWHANQLQEELKIPVVADMPAIAQAPAAISPSVVSFSPPATEFSPPTTASPKSTFSLPDFSGFGGPTNDPTSAPQVAAVTPQIELKSMETAAPRPILERDRSEPAGADLESSPAIVASTTKPSGGVSTQLFIIVASYASAVTLAFIYIYLKTINGSALDLPDRRPKFDNKGRAGVSIYPDGPLPGSHRIKLGESRQYGSLRVTPVKVTKGPLEFVYHTGDDKLKRSPTPAPVLKLWVKFENVSTDQVFPALDEDLVYTKRNDRSNNYLCSQAERVPGGKKIGVYEWPTNSEWLMKNQKLDTELKPGETWETYIPSNDEQAIERLEGPVAWRVHFRKGYNRTTYRGVTTIVEVEFDSSDIQKDS